MVEIEIANQQNLLSIDEDRLRLAVRRILDDKSICRGEISIALVDDETIHELNRRWLDHDEPTDVLSFILERDGDSLDGEIVASAETAIRAAIEYGWNATDELLLYVIHGTLHLVGHLDSSDQQRLVMRERERHYLAGFGLQPRYAASDSPAADDPQHACQEEGSQR